jgi:hypothetical protein
MVALIPIILAEGFAVKAMAFVALCLVAYLYWTGVCEKREVRRLRQWQAEKRREAAERAARRNEPPRPS